MARRLTAAGMRPISNVVDVSNYVMLELNQPNHAYDLDTLGGGGFRVRTAHDGEQLTTLDGQERTFTDADLLICDADDVPIGLAGIMGGLDTEISDATTDHRAGDGLVRAWSASARRSPATGCAPRRRPASSVVSIRTGCPTAIARFVELLGETCPDLAVHAGAVDARTGDLPPADRTVDVRIAQVNRILGTDVAADDLPALLDPIGYTVAGTRRRPHGHAADVAARHDRGDRRRRGGRPPLRLRPARQDRAEVGRARRTERAPATSSPGAGGAARPRDLRGDAEPVPRARHARTRRARRPERCRSPTRSSPTRACCARRCARACSQAIAYNESHRRTGVRLFEIGHVYPPSEAELPAEYEALTVVLAGAEAPAAMAVWRELSTALGVGARIDQSKPPAGLHPTRSATLQAGKDPLGGVGEVHPAVLQAFDVSERVAILEVDLDQLLDREPKPTQWKPTSRYPSSDLDLAFVLADDVDAERLDKAIRQGSAICSST